LVTSGKWTCEKIWPFSEGKVEFSEEVALYKGPICSPHRRAIWTFRSGKNWPFPWPLMVGSGKSGPVNEVPGRGVSFHVEVANLLLENLLSFLQGVDMRVP
jgi:hypothetical protein